MAKFSKKMGGKEVGSAEVYAPPHGDTQKNAVPESERMSKLNMSVGNIDRHACPPVKTSGVKIRGTGAATKGTMARGPMA